MEELVSRSHGKKGENVIRIINFRERHFQLSSTASRYGHVSAEKIQAKWTISEEHYAKAILLGEHIEVK